MVRPATEGSLSPDNLVSESRPSNVATTLLCDWIGGRSARPALTASEIVGVRPLLIVPGLLWVGAFMVAGFILEDVRQLLREGGFRTTERAEAKAVSGR